MQHKKTSRRELLKLSAGTLLSIGLWPGHRAFAESTTDDFSIAVLNDLHCVTDDCGVWLESVCADVKKRAPQFCVIAGDLTDNAEIKYMDMVGSVFSKVGCPLHVQIGNHDYISDTDRSSFEKVFPDSLNYYFEHGGWQFFALDTSQGQLAINSNIGSDTLSWLDKKLPRISKSKPTAIFTHFPLAGKIQTHPLNSNKLLEKFLDYNLQTVFSGHFHGYTENKSAHATLLTNKCCALKRNNHDGTKEKGYFLCHLKNGSIQKEFIQMSPKA